VTKKTIEVEILLAIDEELSNIVHFIIKTHSIDLSWKKNLILHELTRYGYTDLIIYIIENSLCKKINYDEMFEIASEYGVLPLIKYLAERNLTDINKVIIKSFNAAHNSGNTNVAEYLFGYSMTKEILKKEYRSTFDFYNNRLVVQKVGSF